MWITQTDSNWKNQIAKRVNRFLKELELRFENWNKWKSEKNTTYEWTYKWKQNFQS